MDLVDQLAARIEAARADREVQLLTALAEVVRRQRERAADRQQPAVPSVAGRGEATTPTVDGSAQRPAAGFSGGTRWPQRRPHASTRSAGVSRSG